VRSPALPDVPTSAESGLPGFEVILHYGLAAPAGTPRRIVERLNKELQILLSSDETRQRLLAEGSEPEPGTPDDYGANIHREEGKWAALVKKLGLKLE
jgi:tripartite-type tricarboxylate transporter receptor subunit TctC